MSEPGMSRAALCQVKNNVPMTRESENIHMKAGNKKQLIADTYLKLLEKNPNDKITVKMLIDECGLSRQTFYYHFKDIIDLVEYALHGILDNICEECIRTGNAKEAIRVFLQAICDNRNLAQKLDNSVRHREFQSYMMNALAEMKGTLLDEFQDENEPRMSRSDEQFLFSYFSYGLIGYLLERIRNNQELDVDTMTDQLYRLFLGDMKILSHS